MNNFTYLKSNKNYRLLIILCIHNNRLGLVIIAYNLYTTENNFNIKELITNNL